MYNILCFGDSNTFGYDYLTGGRLDYSERWTGILQQLLGNNFNVIEAGLNGRTTAFDDPFRYDRNGRTVLPMILDQSRPLDLVILFLGSNDLKQTYGQDANSIALGLQSLIRLINERPWDKLYPKPKILVLSPPVITRACLEGVSEFSESSVENAHKLSYTFLEIAKRHGCFYTDLAKTVKVCPDGLHLDKEGHKQTARIIFEEIKNEIL